MPTGYTAKTMDGEPETIAEFVTHLCRGLGAYVMQRDESADEPLKPRQVSDYYYNAVTNDQKRLNELLSMTDDEKTASMEKENDDVLEYYAQQVDRYQTVSERYQDRLNQFQTLDWSRLHEDGPVGEFFKGLYDFGYSQLKSSIDFDCHEPTPPTLHDDVDKWYADKVKYAAESLARSAQRLQEEVVHVSEQNLIHKAVTKWVKEISDENA